MKSFLKVFSFLLIFLCSCTSESNSLQGRWVVERVNFDFDERRNTPEMISQIGREESKDELIFKNDSVVYIKMASFNGDYQYVINEKSEICFKGSASDNKKTRHPEREQNLLRAKHRYRKNENHFCKR